jgi:Ribonucleotide reductase, barrel domain.
LKIRKFNGLILFNSGIKRPQLSSFSLTIILDDLDGLFSAMKDYALLSKWAGGLGNDWTPVRANEFIFKRN